MFRDLQFALRQVRRAPASSATVIATLALAIGANGLVYSVLSTTVLNPLPVPDVERIVQLWRLHQVQGFVASPGPEVVQVWRETVQGLDAVESVQWTALLLTDHGDPARVPALKVSPGFFALLGMAPRYGRVFSPQDVAADHRLVILGHGLFRTQFGSDPQIVGRTIRLEGEPYVVVAVMPPHLRLPAPLSSGRLWIPFAPDDGGRGDFAFGKIVAGSDVATLNAELAGLALPQDEFAGRVDGLVGYAEPAAAVWGEYGNTVWALQGAVGFVLLIAVCNVANMLMARGGARAREMAVRSALGGSRARLIRQMLLESAVPAALGGALGLGLAVVAVRALQRTHPEALGNLDALRLEPHFVGATILIIFLTALSVGIGPALQTTRARGHGLVGGPRGGTDGRDRRRLRGALVVAQVALSMALLVGAALLVGSFLRMHSRDPGVAADALGMRLNLSSAVFPDAPARDAFWRRLQSDLATALGGADPRVALASRVPPQGGRDFGAIETDDGRRPFAEQVEQFTAATWVHGDYSAAVGLPVLAGRELNDADRRDGVRNAVINRAFAAAAWPGSSAVGRRYRVEGGDGQWNTVVGVVGDVLPFGLTSDIGARQTYFALADEDQRVGVAEAWLLVRSGRGPETVVGVVRRVVDALGPDVAIGSIATMGERMAATIALPRFTAELMLMLAVGALALAAVGIYGVLSYSVSRRTREMGVRLALGATPRALRRDVVRQGLVLVVAGLALGGLAGFGVARTLASLTDRVSADTPWPYVICVSTLLAAGFAATWIPATRATRIDPMVALRAE